MTGDRWLRIIPCLGCGGSGRVRRRDCVDCEALGVWCFQTRLAYADAALGGGIVDSPEMAAALRAGDADEVGQLLRRWQDEDHCRRDHLEACTDEDRALADLWAGLCAEDRMRHDAFQLGDVLLNLGGIDAVRDLHLALRG